MKALKSVLIVAVLLSLISVPVLGGGQAEAEEKFVVGFVPRAFVSVYFVTMADAVKEAADANPNIEVEIVAPMDQKDIEGQVKIVEDFTQKKVDLLAISVNDPKALVPSMKEAQAAGIPVIILDALTPYPGIEVLSLIGSNNEDGGEIVGKTVVELLGEKGKMAILEGVPGQFANEMRLKGFRRIVNEKDTPGIEIAASQPANWQRELAMSTMENILQGNPDIDLVWGVNDGMALGALKAVTDAGLQDKMKVLGYNGDEEAVESVNKGQMYSTILQQPAEIGRMVITIAEMIKTGKKDEVESVITIPIVKVTKENAAQYLKK